MAQLVYTFYINDPDPESGIFGCVAESEAAAEKLARKMGYKDFFLANTRELEPHESESFVDRSVRGNPFVGEQWLGVIKAIEILIAERTFSRRSPTWTMQTYGRRYGSNPDTSPYVQAILEADGSLHVELSGNIICVPPITESQIEQLEWVGWEPPIEDDSNMPNFHRLFEPGWHPRYVAERIVESLTSIMGIAEDDHFNFSENPATIERIVSETGLYRLPADSRHNPNGSIFSLAKPDNVPTDVIRPEDIRVVEFDDGLPGRTESVDLRFWAGLANLPAKLRFSFQRESETVMCTTLEGVLIFVQAFPWEPFGEAVNVYSRAVTDVDDIDQLRTDLSDGYYGIDLDLDPVIGQWSYDLSASVWFHVRMPLKALESGNVFADTLAYVSQTVRDARPALAERYSGSIPTDAD